MERLEYGTKVLVFKDKDDLLLGRYSFGTIIGYSDETINSSEEYKRLYTVEDEQEENAFYTSCLYGKDIITPEDYRKYLSLELKNNNYRIKNLLEKNQNILDQLNKFNDIFYKQNVKEKGKQKKLKK